MVELVVPPRASTRSLFAGSKWCNLYLELLFGMGCADVSIRTDDSEKAVGRHHTLLHRQSCCAGLLLSISNARGHDARNACFDRIGPAFANSQPRTAQTVDFERSIGDRLPLVRVLSAVLGAATLRFGSPSDGGKYGCFIDRRNPPFDPGHHDCLARRAAPACANVITDWDAKAIDALRRWPASQRRRTRLMRLTE